jgi:hypothetical protein
MKRSVSERDAAIRAEVRKLIENSLGRPKPERPADIMRKKPHLSLSELLKKLRFGPKNV